MKEVTITKIERRDEISKNTGKGYQRVYIWTAAGGDTKLSGFGDVYTDHWNVGDTVKVEIKQVGAFWNFKPVPVEKEKIEEPTGNEIIEAKLKELDFRLGMVEQVLREKEKSGVEKIMDEMEKQKPFQQPTI